MADLTLSVAHLSDTHSRVAPHLVRFDGPAGEVTLSVGGYPLQIAAIKAARRRAQEAGNVFLAVHSGDTFQGSTHFEQYPGTLNAAMLNLMALDAVALGNHEFDNGPIPFADFCNALACPVLASNVDVGAEAHPALKNCLQTGDFITAAQRLPVVLHAVPDNPPLAIIGLTLEDLPDFADTGHGVTVRAAIDCARQLVADLHARGIFRIIVLSHLGLPDDRVLAKAVPDLSVILGGHTHVLMGAANSLGFSKEPPSNSIEGNTPILHCGANATHLGVYNLTLNDMGCAVEMACETVAPIDTTDLSQNVLNALSLYPDVVLTQPDFGTETVLSSCFPLEDTGGRPPLIVERAMGHVRVPMNGDSGSVLAQLMVDAVLAQVRQAGFAPDIAILNAGVIRMGIDAGQYDQPAKMLAEVVPFDLEMMVFTVSGDVLMYSLERAQEQSAIVARSGRYPYVAPNGTRLDPDRRYTVVTTAYIASGKDGFVEFATKSKDMRGSELKLRQICETWLRGSCDHTGSFVE